MANLKKYASELLEISNALLDHHTAKENLQVVYEAVQPIFPFDNVRLFALDRGQDLFWEIAEDTSALQARTGKNRLLGPFTYSGHAPETFIYSKKSVICTVKDQSAYCPDIQWEAMITDGLQEMIAGPLLHNGLHLGFFCFSRKAKKSYSQMDFPLFEAIGKQLSLIAYKVLEQEKSAQREKEKDLLLGIIQKVSKIRYLPDFLRFVVQEIKPLFNFYDVGIFLLTEDQQYHYDIAGIKPNISQSDWNTEINDSGVEKTLHAGSLIEWMMKGIDNNNGIYCFDFVDLQKRFPDYYQFTLREFLDDGYRDCLAANLKVGDNIYGMFCINAIEKDFFAKEQFPLFKSITEQLSVAVSDILINERLLEEKQKTEDLLEISTAASNIKNRKELLKIIFETIKSVFSFDTAGLFIIDQQNDEHYEILDDVTILGKHDDTQVNIINSDLLGRFPHKGSAVDYLSRGSDPRLFNVKKDRKKWSHPQLDLMYAHGLRQVIGIGLRSRNETFGMLCFNSKQENAYSKNDFHFFKSISKQVALAVSNLLANEELLIRQKRIEDLLEISTAASNIQNRKELLKVIFEKIQPIFSFDTAGLFIIDQQYDEHYEILDDIEILGKHDHSQVNIIKSDLLGRFKHKGSTADYLSRGSDPHLFNIEKDSKKWPHPQIAPLYDSGMRQIIGIGLRTGNESFGMLCFNSKQEDFYSEKDFTFFKAISEQVALAVKNVLANEEILQEKQKVENLLSISNTISTIASGADLIRLILTDLKKIFPFDDAGLFVYDYEAKKERDLVVDYNFNMGFSQKLYDDGLSGWMPITEASLFCTRNGPLVTTPDELLSRFPHPHFEHLKEHGFKKMIGGPLKSGGEVIGMLCFWSVNENAYSGDSMVTFKSISDQVGIALSNILAKEEIIKLNNELKLERDYLIEEVKTEHNFEEIIGNSPLLKEVFKSVEMVAQTDATVLIEGETGTGKELIARAIHNRSDRKKKPMVKVNCATLPKELIESELFGHEKGSFTGAFERRIGKFELAHKGSLFLDEIGEMPFDLQATLLRAIQEKEIERLGGKEFIKVDVRIIVATNRNLKEESEQGNFRQDLYYRLNVFPIHMPALRQRKEDIPLLATFFAQKYCSKFNTGFKGIKEKAMQELLEYNWPGNIRELENLVEQACILNQGQALSWARDLVPTKRRKKVVNENQKDDEFDIKAIKQEQLQKERETLLKALKKTNWRIRGDKGAAKLLGVKATTLEYRMGKLGLK